MPICDNGSYRPKAFNIIATECTQVAGKLVQKLQGLKYSGKRQPWKAVRRALKSVWSKNDIDALESRLNSYRQQLILQKVFAPDKHDEYVSFGTRFDSLNESNSHVLNDLAVLSKALNDVQNIQKSASPSATAIPIPQHPQHCEDGNSTDNPGVMFQDNAFVPTSEQFVLECGGTSGFPCRMFCTSAHSRTFLEVQRSLCLHVCCSASSGQATGS